MKPDDNKVIMLLDIDNFYGQHEGRLGPMIKFICIGVGPALLWAYYGFPIPAFLFLPLWIIWLIRSALIILGREKERLDQFRKIMNDDFASIYELLNIKTVHADGCIEYVSGACSYAVVATNGTTYDPIQRSKQIRDFLTLLGSDFDIDVYVQNITDVKSLEDRYSNVKLFTDEEAAKDFIDIIDHNRSVVSSRSLLTRTIFVVKGRRNNWTEIRDNCKMAIYSASARAFKDVHVAQRAEIQDILNTDIRGVVDLDALLQQKYATHQYHGSRVLYFGEEEEHIQEDPIKEERGFMKTDE